MVYGEVFILEKVEEASDVESIVPWLVAVAFFGTFLWLGYRTVKYAYSPIFKYNEEEQEWIKEIKAKEKADMVKRLRQFKLGWIADRVEKKDAKVQDS